MTAAIIGAIIGAVVTVLLTWYFTPDYKAELSAVRQEMESLRERIATIDRERTELEHLPLNLTLRPAVPGNYIVDVKNDSDKEVLVETVTVRKGELDLCDPCKPPKATDDWTILARGWKQLCFAPQPDPGTKLRAMMPELGEGQLTEIELVLGCKVSGRPKVFRKTVSVTVSRSGDWITAY